MRIRTPPDYARQDSEEALPESVPGETPAETSSGSFTPELTKSFFADA